MGFLWNFYGISKGFNGDLTQDSMALIYVTLLLVQAERMSKMIKDLAAGKSYELGPAAVCFLIGGSWGWVKILMRYPFLVE